MKIIEKNQVEHAELLVRFFQFADGSVIPGHPYITFRTEQRMDGWYVLAVQTLPWTSGDISDLRELDGAILGDRGPYLSDRDATIAGLEWDDAMIQSLYRYFDEKYLSAADRDRIERRRKSWMAKRIAQVRA